MREPWKEKLYEIVFEADTPSGKVLPTYLAIFLSGTQISLVIRVIRLFRIFRILKLAHSCVTQLKRFDKLDQRVAILL
jgi:hypothetical protein